MEPTVHAQYGLHGNYINKCHYESDLYTQYLDCRSGCIAQSEGQGCPGTCVSRNEYLFEYYATIVLYVRVVWEMSRYL